ncbi:prephenate dehydrogenase/arogenate dehydrogenase family protein [Haloglomus litoreum]|uniref:prephenate dehydrogenase/arogenate dehydrogenase family protein n=1 Tax=Haloglomus litoreum TaxID=3034026 RepID=UPI0023E8C00E|nr:prephenate dehydrogenase/arogenate dehydrogenase family protein [Haloglomus sp. DT116]
MHLLVVGAGTMGRWFARSVAPAVDRVAFADDDETAARAAVAAFAERVADEPDAPTATVDDGGPVDLVCVAVPISAVPEAVAEHGPRAERAVVDVSGEMETAVTALADAAPDRERASFHPLFAPDNEPGNCAVVVDRGGPAVRAIREALADRGNRVFDTTPAEHDRAMATVQARTHAAVLAFGLAAEDVPEEFHTPVSEPLADLVANVTGGNPDVYAEIQAAFEGADAVADAARRVAEVADDFEAFAELYAEAGAAPFGGAAEGAPSRTAADDRTDGDDT